MIDLRSDTVTRPSPEMRVAMAQAEVGDDVFGEDPTVKHLENLVADLLGKEAGLFVPSGTMANQIGMMVHTEPGDEVIVDRQSHIFNYESGASSALGGVQLHVVDGENGLPSSDQIEAVIRPGNYWEPQTKLLCLENTMNKAGGIVFSPEEIEESARIARAHSLAVHLDGARLWHATVATESDLQEYAALADTVWVALSKGLGAPVGSVLAGSRELMQAAHRYRKMLGGGMRQVGILAAAGIFAIENHLPKLAHDHEKAQTLADAVESNPAFRIDRASVQSNIVMFDTADKTAATDIVDLLKQDDVLVVPFSPTTIRATVHRDVSMEDVEKAGEVLSQLKPAEESI